MGVGKYFLILVFMSVTFLALIDLVFKLPVVRYELALLTIFLIVAIAVAVGFYYERQGAYYLGVIFFAANLINMIYLYYRVTSYSLVWLAIASALGFIVSVSSIGKKEEGFGELEEKREAIEKQLRGEEKEIPKVEIIRDEKKPRKTKGKKRKGKKKKDEVLKNF